MTQLGSFLKDLRGELSLRDVEKATGIQGRLVLAYENAEKLPGPDNLHKLAEYYEVSYEDIRAKYYEDCLADGREQAAAIKALQALGKI